MSDKKPTEKEPKYHMGYALYIGERPVIVRKVGFSGYYYIESRDGFEWVHEDELSIPVEPATDEFSVTKVIYKEEE